MNKRLSKLANIASLFVILIISFFNNEEETKAAPTTYTTAKSFYNNYLAPNGKDGGIVYAKDNYIYFGYKASKGAKAGYIEIGTVYTLVYKGTTYQVATSNGQTQTQIQYDTSDNNYVYALFAIDFKDLCRLFELRYPSVNFDDLYNTTSTTNIEGDMILTIWNENRNNRTGSIYENGKGWITYNGSLSWDLETWREYYNEYFKMNISLQSWKEAGIFNQKLKIYAKTPVIKNTNYLSAITTGTVFNAHYNGCYYVKANTPFNIVQTTNSDIATSTFQPDSNFVSVVDTNGNIKQVYQIGMINNKYSSASATRFLYGANYLAYLQINAASSSQTRSSDLKSLTAKLVSTIATSGTKLILYTTGAIHKNGSYTTTWRSLDFMSVISSNDMTRWSGYTKGSKTIVVADGDKPYIKMSSGNYIKGKYYISAVGTEATVSVSDDLSGVKSYILKDSNGNIIAQQSYNGYPGVTQTYKFSFIPEKEKTYTITISDQVGNTYIDTFTIETETNPPTITPNYDLTKWYNTNINVVYTLKDTESGMRSGYEVLYFKTGYQYATATKIDINTASVSAGQNAANQFIEGYDVNRELVYAQDNALNAKQETFYVKIDKTPPVVENNKNTVFYSDIDYYFEAYDVLSGMKYIRIYDERNAVVATTRTVEDEMLYTTSEDTYTGIYKFNEPGKYKIAAVDQAGNESEFKEILVLSDISVTASLESYREGTERYMPGDLATIHIITTGYCNKVIVKFSNMLTILNAEIEIEVPAEQNNVEYTFTVPINSVVDDYDIEITAERYDGAKKKTMLVLSVIDDEGLRYDLIYRHIRRIFIDV